ncbi:MAG: L,D-transpeptidase [Bacillota bacterium]
MSHLQEPRPLHSAQAAWRRREARRRKYLRRRAMALLILLALVGALAYGLDRLVARWRQPGAEPAAASGVEPEAGAEQPGAAQPAAGSLPFTPERYLEGPDLDGDGQAERVAVGPAAGGMRQLALLSGPAGRERLLGRPLTLPDFPVSLQNLSRAQQVLVWEGELPRRGSPARVQVGGATAVLAAGGEPDRRAWRLDPSQGFVPVDYYMLIAPQRPPEPTLILVDKGLNALWFYENGELVQTARVATGRHLEGPAPTASTHVINFLTPTGRHPIILRQPGMTYYREKIPPLDPRNPLGSHWLGFRAFEGDLGQIWGIHGTNDPSRIGRWVTDGGIEMRNEEIERLYARVKLGTPILIQNSLAP